MKRKKTWLRESPIKGSQRKESLCSLKEKLSSSGSGASSTRAKANSSQAGFIGQSGQLERGHGNAPRSIGGPSYVGPGDKQLASSGAATLEIGDRGKLTLKSLTRDAADTAGTRRCTEVGGETARRRRPTAVGGVTARTRRSTTVGGEIAGTRRVTSEGGKVEGVERGVAAS